MRASDSAASSEWSDLYIKRVSVENVKSFRAETTFEFGAGVNYLVGDNNGGKSTALEALLFLFEGPTATRWTPDAFYSTNADGATRVTADIAGGVDSLVTQPKYSVLTNYVFEEDGEKIFRVERRSDEREVEQPGKKKLTVKSFCFWNEERGQFENPTGIDALAKSIIDFEPIWADAQPGDHIDFGSGKTLGRLIDTAFQRFTKTERWETLVAAHASAFAPDDAESFSAETDVLAAELKSIVEEQYGPAAMRFGFNLPDAGVFMKQGGLHVDDGGGETPVSGKGTGMQRAIALGIIQLYAKSTALADEDNPTPLILMLDEPETWLHPTAQLRLGDALCAIGEKEQVFIITHSPYLIRKFDHASHNLAVVTIDGEERRIQKSTNLGLLGPGEPTWGEINYRAFDICSHEFHNELYGFVQRHLEHELKLPEHKNATEKEIDGFLETSGFAKSKRWVRHPTLSYDVTPTVYVRNSIHHPENHENVAFTEAELRESTVALVSLVEQIAAVQLAANGDDEGAA